MKRSLLILLALTGALVAGAAVTGSSAAGAAVGAVYTITNSPGGNAVAVYTRASDGSLRPAGSVPTGGLEQGRGSNRRARW